MRVTVVAACGASAEVQVRAPYSPDVLDDMCRRAVAALHDLEAAAALDADELDEAG